MTSTSKMSKMKRNEHAAAQRNAKEGRENETRNLAGPSSSGNVVTKSLEPNPEINQIPRKKSRKFPISCPFCPQSFLFTEFYNLHYAEKHVKQHGPLPDLENSNTVKDTTKRKRKRRRYLNTGHDWSHNYSYFNMESNIDDIDDSDYEIPIRANIYKKTNTLKSNLNKNRDNSELSESSDEDQTLINSDYDLSTRANINKTSNNTEPKLNKETDISEISESSDDDHRLINSDNDLSTGANIYKSSNTTDPKLNKDSDSSEISESSDDDHRLINSDNDLSTRTNIYKTSNTAVSKLNKENDSSKISESSDNDLSTLAKNINANTTEPKLNKKRKFSEMGQDSDNSCFDSDNDFRHIFNKYAKKISNCLSNMQKRFKSTIRVAYKCKTCSLHFLEKSEWRKHLVTGIHTVNSSKCDHCMLNFSTKSMRQHLKMHEKNGKIEKKLKFSIITDTNYSLSENITDTSSESSGSDNEEKMSDETSKPGCSKTAIEKPATEKSNENTEDNIKKISNDQVHSKRRIVFRCETCYLHFLKKSEWRKHLLTGIHTVNSSLCLTCKLNFSNKSILKHLKTHEKNEKGCQIISSTNYSSSENIIDTSNESSESDDEEKISYATLKPGCSKIGIEKPATEKSYNNKDKDNHKNTLNDKAKLFQCDDCEKHFLNRKTLEKHTKEGCTSRGKNCNTCKIQFSCTNALLKHLRLHHKRHDLSKEDFKTLTNLGKTSPMVRINNPRSNSIKSIQSRNHVPNNNKSNHLYNKEMTMYKCEGCALHFINRKPWVSHLLICKNKLNDAIVKECPYCKLYFRKNKTWNNHLKMHDKYPSITKNDFRIQSSKPKDFNTVTVSQSEIVTTTAENWDSKTTINEQANVDFSLNQSSSEITTNADESCKVILAAAGPNGWRIVKNESKYDGTTNDVVSAENINAMVADDCGNMNQGTESVHELSNKEINLIESTNADTVVKLFINNVRATVDSTINDTTNATESTKINEDHIASSRDNIIPSTFDKSNNKLIESTNKDAVVNLNPLLINNVSFTVDTVTNNVTNAIESTKNNEDDISSSQDNIIPSTFDNSNNKLHSESTGHVVNTADTATKNIAIACHNEDSYAHNKNKKYYYSETELINILSDNVSNLIESTQKNNPIETESTHILSDNESKLIESTNKAAVVNLNPLHINNVSFTVDTATVNLKNTTESTKKNEDHISSSPDNIIPSTSDNSNNKLNSECTGHVINTADTVTENIAMASHNEDSFAPNKNKKHNYSETELINILSDNVNNLIESTYKNNHNETESIHILSDNTTNATESTKNNEDHISSSRDNVIPSSFDNSSDKLHSESTGHVVNTADTATENITIASHSEDSNAHNKNQINYQNKTQYETFIKNERIEKLTVDRAIKKEMIDEQIETNNCNPSLFIKKESTRDSKIEVIIEKTEDLVQNSTQMKNRDCKKEIKAENIESRNYNGHAKSKKIDEVIKMENVTAEDGQVIKNEKNENNSINYEILLGEQLLQNVINTETENIAPKVEKDIKKENYEEEIEYYEPAPQLECNSSTLDYIKIVNYYSIRLELEKPSSSGGVKHETDNIDSPEIIHDKETMCDNTKYFSDEYENPQSTNGELYINYEMSSSNHELNKIQQNEERDDMIHQCDENTMIFIEDERSINSTHFEETFLKSEYKSEIINKNIVHVSNDNEKRSHFSELNTQNKLLCEVQDDTNRELNEGLYDNNENFSKNNTCTSNNFTFTEITNNKNTTHASFLRTDIFSTDQEGKGSTSDSFYFGGLNLNRNNSEVFVKDEEYLTDISHIKKEEKDEERATNRQLKSKNKQIDKEQQTIEEIIISDDDDDDDVVMVPKTEATVVISDDEEYFS